MQGPLPTITLAAVPNGAVADARPGYVSGPGATEVAPYGESDVIATNHPLILAIESSCDETAAAVVDGAGIWCARTWWRPRWTSTPASAASSPKLPAASTSRPSAACATSALDVAAAQPGAMPSLPLARPRRRGRHVRAGTRGRARGGRGLRQGRGLGRPTLPFIVRESFGRAPVRQQDRRCRISRRRRWCRSCRAATRCSCTWHDWGDYRSAAAPPSTMRWARRSTRWPRRWAWAIPAARSSRSSAAEGDPDAIPFPRAMLHSGDLRFSLSGLKTAVVTYINNERAAGRELDVPDICASFTAGRCGRAGGEGARGARARPARPPSASAAAWRPIRSCAPPTSRCAPRMGVRLVMPPLAACGDNAGMIARRGARPLSGRGRSRRLAPTLWPMATWRCRTSGSGRQGSGVCRLPLAARSVEPKTKARRAVGFSATLRAGRAMGQVPRGLCGPRPFSSGGRRWRDP